MTVEELWAAFGGDFDAIAQALGWTRQNTNRLKRANKLVPLLKAFRLTADYPERFPNPVDWKAYETEHEAIYARRDRKPRKRRAKRAARPRRA